MVAVTLSTMNDSGLDSDVFMTMQLFHKFFFPECMQSLFQMIEHEFQLQYLDESILAILLEAFLGVFQNGNCHPHQDVHTKMNITST